METGAVGNLEWGRTKGEIQSPSWNTLTPQAPSYCQLQCVKRLSKGHYPKLGVQRLLRSRVCRPSPRVASRGDRNKTSCKPMPSCWPHPLQGPGTHGSACMVWAGTGGHVSGTVGRGGYMQQWLRELDTVRGHWKIFINSDLKKIQLDFLFKKHLPEITLSLENTCFKVLVTQLCPTLCDLMDCSLPGFSVHGILQTRIREWVAFSSLGSSWPGIRPGSPTLQADSLLSEPPGKPYKCLYRQKKIWKNS